MDQSTNSCIVSSCVALAKHVGLCGSHYQQKRNGQPFSVRPVAIECSECSRGVHVGAHGPVPTICDECKAARRRAARVVPPLVRACAVDGCSVALERVPGKRGAVFCAQHADDRLGERRRAASPDSLSSFCTVAGCDRPRRARGVCNMHYKQILRAEGRIAEAPWNDRRRSNHQARRARKLGSTVTSAALLGDIIERDGLLCGACGVTVDLDLAWPDPFSKSVDHIVPLARGGSHSLDNCQLMHLRCNISKGARMAA